jgi:cholesterol oxidase
VPPPPSTPKTSLTFTEEMKGSVAEGATAATHDEYQAAAAHGKPLMFHLDVTAADVDAFVTSPAHETDADGYIDSPLYGGRRPAKGTVNLFVNQADPSKKNMRYRLFFTAADGRALTLTGFKDIAGPAFTSMWAETTTLYTQILEGHVAAGQQGPVVASGVLVIRPEDFVFRQMFSFRTKGPSPAARLGALNRFGAMFFGKVWDVYGHQAGPF